MSGVVFRSICWMAGALARRAGEALLLAALAAPALADAPEPKRVALVIGNGAYENAPRLDNAAFDARAVADAFRKLGFQVVDGYDLDIERMRAKVSEFSASLPGAKSAVIYYAGHGISMDDENYLIPTDITLKSPTDLDLGALSVSLLLRQMKREDRVNIVILDACRDNPFAATLSKAKTRALVAERGLSRIDGDLARGTLIAFASDPKSIALDGSPGQHSPFTEAFLAHVFDPVSIDAVMSRVRAEVWEKTRQGQLPWVNTSLIGDYSLNPEAPAAPAPVAAGPAGDPRDALLWDSAQHSNLAADYRAYLDAFPAGMFAQMAKNRIASLESGRPGEAQIASRAPAETTPAEPPQADAWKREIGAAETEKALALTPVDEKEIQQRLIALGLYKGPATGALDSLTRQALADWQKTRGAAPTSYLGPLQLAALRSESEAAYQKALTAPMAAPPPVAARPTPAQPQASRQAAKPVQRAVNAQPADKPPRQVVKRRSRTQTADDGGAPPPDNSGGTPEWRRRAGLPVYTPDRWGPAVQPSAGFWAGAAAGAAGGLLLQHLH
jgi:peptidoglycan hydrolase-like protein with peptidoglycan-binding domain